MPIQGIDISLNIRNNTNYPQQINVMGNPTNLLDTSNATTEYRWDITGFTITFQNFVSVQYKRNTEPTFDTFSWELDGTNLQSLLVALNNLGIGYFNLYDELGNTYIGTYNQNYAFGDLNVYNPSISTTTTTTTTTIAPTTTTTTTSTTTAAPTTSTTTTTTTAAPTTSTTTTTTTAAPTTTTSTTTTTTTNLVYSEFTLGYSALNGNDSCAQFLLVPTSYYAVAGTIVLVNGTILYTDTSLTTLAPNGYYSNGGDNWAIVGGNGTLTTQTACNLTTTTTTTTTTAAPTTTTTTTSTTTAAPTTTTTTTTTTAAPTTTTTTSTTTSTTTIAFSTYSLQPSNIDQAGACSDYPAGLLNFYTAFGATLQDGTIIYTDTALTTLAADGYYSNGAFSWATSGGTGVLANETACTIISYSIGYNIFNGGTSYTGYNTNIDSCLAGGTLPVIGVFSNGVLADGEVLFLDAALTIPFVSTGGYYWASGGIGIYYYFTYSGQVIGFNDCPTTTTSTTTTTTTLANFNGSVNWASNQYDACNNPSGSVNVTGNDPLFCNSTIFTSAGFVTFANGNYILAYGGNSLNINISGAPTTTATMFGGGCSSCPTPTTTTSTTTTTTTLTPPVVNFVTFLGVSGTTILGEAVIDINITTNQIVTQATSFNLQIVTTNYGTQLLGVTIPSGSNAGTNQVGFGLGNPAPNVTSFCITDCDNYAIDYNTYACSPVYVLNWEWTNNNVIESPPFGGGYIQVSVNSNVIINQSDLGSVTTTYNGYIVVPDGSAIDVYVYSYPNNTYGTETYLSVQSPLSTILYNANDPQSNPGSPSSETFSFVASNAIYIISSSQSY